MATKFTQKGLQSQKRAYSDEATGSVATPLKGLEIQAPGLNPQAAPVSSYIQAGKPNAPGAVQLGELARLPEPAEITDLKNLTQQLGQLNSNLQNAAAGFFADQGRREEEAALQAEIEIAKGTPTAQSVSSSLSKITNDKKQDIQIREGANKATQQITSNWRVQKHIEAKKRQQSVLSNVYNLGNNALTATVTNEAGEEVPLASIPAGDPLYQQWLRGNIYQGAENLNSRDHKAINPTIQNGISQDIARQNKANQSYQVEQMDILESDTAITQARLLAQHGSNSVFDVSFGLQEVLDKRRDLLPFMTAAQIKEANTRFPQLFAREFIKNNKNQPASLLEEVLNELMIGPSKDRYSSTLQVKDGVTISGYKVNEKLRWVNSLDEGLDSLLAETKEAIRQVDVKEDNFDKFDGNEEVESIVMNDIKPLITGPGGVTAARNELQRKLNTWAEKAERKGVDPTVIKDVLANGYDTFNSLTERDEASIFNTKNNIDKLLSSAINDPTIAYKALKDIDKAVETYGDIPGFLDWARTARKEFGTAAKTATKIDRDGLKNHIKSLTEEFMDRSKLPDSYDGRYTNREEQIATDATIKANKLGLKIIREEYENGTPENISTRIIQELNNQSLGLIMPGEQIWNPQKGVVYSGTETVGLESLDTEYEWLPGGLMPNDFRELQNHVLGTQPMFEPSVISDLADKAISEGFVDPRLIKVFKAIGISPGDYFIQQFGKLGIDLNDEAKEELKKLNQLKL